MEVLRLHMMLEEYFNAFVCVIKTHVTQHIRSLVARQKLLRNDEYRPFNSPATPVVLSQATHIFQLVS